MPPASARLFDASAISLSGLCLIHCLALPVVALFLPALAVWSHAEWVHGVFVAFAIPITTAALWRAARSHGLPLGVILLATPGLLCLLAGALEWPRAQWETPITVAGSLMLASAHIWNWRRHRLAHHHD
ncbi:MAG: hypothetical protein JWP35_715 [Caulobacter sp.]|nr:hypothetical protein [Caulobacter sp.]